MNENLKQEKEAFGQMPLFVRSQLDKVFETCGITCREVIETDICGIISRWTFEPEKPRAPKQRVHIWEELKHMIERLPPPPKNISFPRAGLHLVHFEIYPREFDSLKARFGEIRHYAIEGPEQAGTWWLMRYVTLAESGYWQAVREQLAKDYEQGCGFISRNETESE